jgi:hypothetical protein
MIAWPRIILLGSYQYESESLECLRRALHVLLRQMLEEKVSCENIKVFLRQNMADVSKCKSVRRKRRKQVAVEYLEVDSGCDER